MLLYLKLAWRNLFRNTRRTLIAGFAIGIGLASLIFVDAFMIGMEQNMIHSATASFLGEGQIHREGFLETFDVEKTIVDFPNIMEELRTEPLVRAFTPRILTLAMISSPANVSSITMVGVDPKTEKELSQVDEALIKGSYFEGTDENDIIIGKKLAEILEVGLGDRIVLTTAEAHTGDLSQAMFRISGIYYFNIPEMDKAMAFIRIDKARSMLNLPNQSHEIAIKFVNTNIGKSKDMPFWSKYSKNGNEAVGWTELLPQLEAAFEMSRFSIWLMGLILFALVSLGIVNTLFMSLYERMFEFGVLRAIGTQPLALGELILFEAASLALLSICWGVLLGFVATMVMSKIGIDYTGIEFAGVTFRELLYPVMRARQYTFYPFWVFIFTTIIGLYPATYAARMNPAKAMRRSF